MTEKDHHCILQSKEEADRAEKLLASEFAKLSVQEREDILFDIHGVREPKRMESDDDTLATKLQELQEEVSLLIERGEATAYKRAWILDRSYVEDEKFRLLFLRAEEFDAKKAAERLVLHFQVKQELFGQQSSDNILVRDVTWNDLSEEDQRIAKSGFFQVGSQRDVAGRTVFLFNVPLMQSDWIPDNLLRAWWYIITSAILTDTELQSRGTVMIVLEAKPPSLQLIRQIVRTRSSQPFLTVAVHQCYDNMLMHMAAVGIRFLMFALEKRQSLRTRAHYGNLEQISFELRTFGIPMDSNPFSQLLEHKEVENSTFQTFNKGLSLAWHLSWLETIQQFERKNEGSKTTDQQQTICIIPRRLDVLFGRSIEAWEHPGSLRCRYLVRLHHEEYEQASRREKTEVASRVMAAIQSSGGRFLRSSDNGVSWIVVEDKAAREKVSHMFRHLREKLNSGRLTNDSMILHQGTNPMESMQLHEKMPVQEMVLQEEPLSEKSRKQQRIE